MQSGSQYCLRAQASLRSTHDATPNVVRYLLEHNKMMQGRAVCKSSPLMMQHTWVWNRASAFEFMEPG